MFNHLTSLLMMICGCLGISTHLLHDLLHIQQTFMFSLYYPTWISSFCHHVWQPVFHIFCILSIKQVCGGFALSGLTLILSNFVAVEMTSHRNSPLPFESMPAWISMALALPINVVFFFLPLNSAEVFLVL